MLVAWINLFHFTGTGVFSPFKSPTSVLFIQLKKKNRICDMLRSFLGKYVINVLLNCAFSFKDLFPRTVPAGSF